VLLGGAGAVAGLGALSLVGCSDDEDPGSTGATGVSTGTTGSTGAATGATGNTGASTGATGATGGSGGASSGIVGTPTDTTAQAKPGGTLKDFQQQEVLHFDAAISNSTAVVNVGSVYAYPRMLTYETKKYPELAEGTPAGEMAESWEVSGDKLTITFKLRQGMAWDPREPTNGRIADAEDVLATWARFVELHPGAGDMANSRSPSASIDSVTAPDNETIVVKLLRPDSAIIPLFVAWDHFYVMPREADGGFDPKTEVRGHGPYMLEEFVPSARVVWAKAPGYYQENRPFPDKIEKPVISDYAQLLAQFKAGNVWTNVITQEDVVAAKQDAPETLLLQNDVYNHAAGPYVSFGWEGDSIFKDIRIRQAMGMMIDGEAYADAINNRDAFLSAGLDYPITYNSVVPSGWIPYWLDPKSADFGPNAKYLEYNLEEAKKLLDAAGYDGAPIDYFYNSELNYGAIYHKVSDVLSGMFAEGGLNLAHKPFPYRTFYDSYFLSYVSGEGFNGMMLRTGRGHGSIQSQLFGGLHPDGSTYHGIAVEGGSAFDGDSELIGLLDDLRSDYELEGQIAVVQDIARYYTEKAYTITRPTNTKDFLLYWPVIGNVGVNTSFRGGNIQAETNIHWWIDESKPPLA
jgi:peptide/nickel transport system substrate-binding protein